MSAKNASVKTAIDSYLNINSLRIEQTLVPPQTSTVARIQLRSWRAFISLIMISTKCLLALALFGKL